MTQNNRFMVCVSTVENIITYVLGEHDPGSAQDLRTSSDLWRPDSPRDQSQLGRGPATKSNEVRKNSKRPLTPPPHFWKIILQIFYDRYGCIYARRYDGQIV